MEQNRRSITLLFVILLALTATYLYVPQFLTRRAQTAQLAALLTGTTTPFTPPLRTKEANCVVNGALPDPACTPGTIFPDAAISDVCTKGYTKEVRNVTPLQRERVYSAYNVSYPEPRGSYEVDHFIPLELGGANDIANLWPEAAQPRPGFNEKDLVENYLHEEVCAGRVALSVAQARMAANWLNIYNNLSPDVLDRLRKAYKSWANH